MWIVVVEEECGEAQCDVLLRWGTEGRTQQLHSSYRDKESSATGGFEEERGGGGEEKNQHMLTYGYNNRVRNEMIIQQQVLVIACTCYSLTPFFRVCREVCIILQ